MANNFCASTANSSGNSENTSLQNPLTIIEMASSSLIPRCQAVEQLIFTNARRGGFVLQLRRVVAALHVREGVRPAVRPDQHRVALGEVTGVGRGGHDLHQATIAVLAIAGGDPLRNDRRFGVLADVDHFGAGVHADGPRSAPRRRTRRWSYRPAGSRSDTSR